MPMRSLCDSSCLTACLRSLLVVEDDQDRQTFRDTENTGMGRCARGQLSVNGTIKGAKKKSICMSVRLLRIIVVSRLGQDAFSAAHNNDGDGKASDTCGGGAAGVAPRRSRRLAALPGIALARRGRARRL